MFKDVIKALTKVGCKVTLESNNYIVKEIDLDNIVAEIPCLDEKKEYKLLQCYYKLAGVK